MTVFSQALLIFLILSVVLYGSYVSAEKRRVFGSLHCCERKCTGGKEVCNLIQVTARNDRWECVTLYDETDYPIRMENGENWRPFWWYNATAGRWPPHETDTLGAQFGTCNAAAHYCVGRLPQYLLEDETYLLAVDSVGNKFRWTFDSGNSTAHAVWLAFHDHQQTLYPDGLYNAEWAPIVVAGGPYRRPQRSFMYRSEHGVVSFMLDDDTCECHSTLSAGHSMCFDSFHRNYGTEDMYGVGLLNENGCDGPSDTNSLFLYYREAVIRVYPIDAHMILKPRLPVALPGYAHECHIIGVGDVVLRFKKTL